MIGELIDDLIQDIMSEAGGSSETAARGTLESVFGTGRGSARTPGLERLLIAEAFAAELADALAPALAEQLAPRLLTAMEQLMAAEQSGKKAEKPASSGRAGGSQGRKPTAK